jgi:tetratricopeptide (TPR) repeat protein
MRSKLVHVWFVVCVVGPAFACVGCKVGFISPEDYIQMGKSFQNKGDYEQAAKHFQMAVDRARCTGDKWQRAGALELLGVVYYAQGKYTEAQSHLEQAVAAFKEAKGPDDVSVAVAIKNLAWFHLQRGNYSEAKSSYDRALDIADKALGPAHPQLGVLKNDQALAYQLDGDLAGAERLFWEAISIFESLEKPSENTNLALANSLRNLGRLYLEQKRWAEAEAVLKRTLGLLKGLGTADADLHKSVLQDHERAVQALEEKR